MADPVDCVHDWVVVEWMTGKMTSLQRFLAFLFVIVFLSALTLSPALGSEQLPWDVERIHSYCVWDNDNWNMTNWNTTAWDVDAGANAGQGVKVAIIDTGMDYSVDHGNVIYHPDLNDSLQLGGMYGFKYDNGVVNVYDQPTDSYERQFIQDLYPFPNRGHGTEVAGVIAAAINGMGIIGAAPKVAIYSLKINSLPNDYASEEEMAKAINYSVDDLHVQVILISLGFTRDNQHLHTACDYTVTDTSTHAGALLISAAGNDNTTTLGYPASYSSVIAVGALDHDDTRAPFSNFGPKLWFMAPGVDVNTTTLNGGYALVNGTSFAAPLVSATAALVWSSKLDPNYGSYWNNAEVWLKMDDTALDLGPPGKDNETGWGLVNAWMANQRPLADINDDHKVDVADIFLVAKAYGSTPGDWNWDPRADINIDKKVDIIDILLVQKNYGKTDP